MNQITFTAGYGDPTRTIKQKYGDYGKIDQLISQLRSENSQLEQSLSEAELKRSSLIEKFQNIKGLNKTEIQEQIQQLTEKIKSIKYTIEENKSKITNAWYGYHERL